jgi:Cu/Ag efflux protein CusF
MKTLRIFRGFVALFSVAFLLAMGAAGQQPKGKSHTLEGKVEAVQAAMLTVNHGKVEGYMDAMTMPYKVDKPDLLKNVKVGDQIKATVYDGDYTLYDVQVVPKQAKAKAK